MAQAESIEHRYIVRVTNQSKTQHYECPTDSRDEAVQYARTAIEDGCRHATVVLSGSGGVTVSWWNKTELDLYKIAHPDWKPGPWQG